MSRCTLGPGPPLLGLALCLLSAAVACDRPPEDVQLRAVPLPGLDGLPESVRRQLTEQHAYLQSLVAAGTERPSRLGVAYGMMGKLYLAYGLADAAEPALQNAADLRPEDRVWHYYLGFLYKSTSRPDQATAYFERVLDLNERDVAARIHLAEAYLELGREAEAQEVLEEALRRDSTAASAHFLLGQIAARDDPKQAIEHYETVLRLQPQASVVHYPLGLAYRQAGDDARSREHLDQRGNVDIAVRDPLLFELTQLKVGPEADMLRGTDLMRQRKYPEAIAAFERVVAEDSTNVSAYLNLGLLLAQSGEAERARVALEQAIRLDPANSRAHYNLGLVYSSQNDREAAMAEFEAALAADPANSAAHFALADLLWREKRCTSAIAHLADHLSAEPGNVEARVMQAICHAELGEYAEARETVEAGYAAFPNRPELQDALVRILAASPVAELRDGPRALQIAERLARAVQRPETMESLAMAYAEVGRFSDAIRIQEQLVRGTERGDMPELLRHLRRNLRRYEAGEACRTPWPPTVFEMR